MSPRSKKQLGKVIPENLQLLSRMIARKPSTYTPEWARSPEESFFRYTNTRTVNLFHSLNEMLLENGWPFPSFMDLEDELRAGRRDFAAGRIVRAIRLARGRAGLGWQLFYTAFSEPENTRPNFDRVMVKYFHRNEGRVFERWRERELLQPKVRLIQEIRSTYNDDLWAACISTILPLLDFVMRNYLETERLNTTIQVLRDAFFEEAKLLPKDLKPGSAIWDAKEDPSKGNVLAKSLEEDLRLPGIYLASFFEFANTYYAWYKSATEPVPKEVNRHAVMHCSGEYWTEVNATKLLMFFDLTLRVEPFLRILVHGQNAAAEIKRILQSQVG